MPGNTDKPDGVEPPTGSRRDFLGLTSLAACAAGLGASALALARMLRPRALPEPSARFRLGDPEEFPAGSERTVPERNVVVVSSTEGLAVISLVCTHLGCIVQTSGEGFLCPCHGSKFGARGDVLAGPAPRALRWLGVSRAPDGTIVVEADREVEPGTYQAV